MKASKIFLYTVVLWAVAESSHARRLRRSLVVEGEGSNLTQKQQQEVIHADVLQHFTTTPGTVPSSESVVPDRDTAQEATSTFAKDVSFVPEEISVQSLKNDDHLRVTFDRRISIDKENPNGDSPDNTNKTVKSNINDVITYKYNQTGPSSSTKSEVVVSHSTYEHSSTSVAYDEDDDDLEVKRTHERPRESSTEALIKVDLERKNFEVKKKEKAKKEILDLVTVPTDFNGAARTEKPYKDNVISVKLREKNKDSIPEALDERRSTTSRISSSSSKISVSDYNKPLDSLDSLKIDSTSANDEESANQSVKSVINGNNVNSESLKKSRVKYSVKRPQDIANDSETDSSANSNQLVEDTAKNTVPVFNAEPQTTSVYLQTSTPADDKLPPKQYPPFRRLPATEPTPTKKDVLVTKSATSSPTTIIKPSIAFKQQLANKLKGLEPFPTAPMSFGDDETDDNQDKASGKSSTKSSLRKKPKPDYYATSSEMYIPPTATAWTLVSMRSAADSLKSSRTPAFSQDTAPEDSLVVTTTRQTTTTSASRVKSFVPWSTRLLKITSSRPPTTLSIDDISLAENTAALSDSDFSSSLSNQQTQQKSEISSQPQPSLPSSTTEQQSVIRTTLELERNLTETSSNIIPSSSNDIMVKDQSSTIPHISAKTAVAPTMEQVAFINLTANEEHSSESPTGSNVDGVISVAEKENTIETKQINDDNDTHSKAEEKAEDKIEEKITTTNNTENEVPSVELSETVNEVKPITANQSFDLSQTTASPTPIPEVVDVAKNRNMSESSDLDPAIGDVLVDTGDDGKSGEESEEDFKVRLTTTLLPLFEPLETTVISDLEEDIDGEIDREEDDLIGDKLQTNQTTTTEITTKSNGTTEAATTSSTTPTPVNVNFTGIYVTSFDIVPRENMTQVVQKTPQKGDINWYTVETKGESVPVNETGDKTIPLDVTTTAAVETTNEPETTTETSKQETTVLPEVIDIVTTVTSPTTAPVTSPSPSAENSTSVELVEDPLSCVRITVHISPLELCHDQKQLRTSIAGQLMADDVSWEQVVIPSTQLQDCEATEQPDEEQSLQVPVCFLGKDLEPSPAIRDEFVKLHKERSYDPSFPIVDVQVDTGGMLSEFDNVLAAIILSVIAAICLVLLGILLVIIRKRQGRFNYGQRCTPVSLDDYSLDNISVHNSIRRKGAYRASKRSYGNPGFDDPGGPSHPINFAGLANFSSDREALDEEFSQIPMITVKPDELPPGAEGKNRYANVIPLPETRVPLQPKEGTDPLDEYINANYIKNLKSQEKLYIACQAPLQSTVEDFWRMVWQQQTQVILMLTALSENGVEKCAEYLPQLEITDCHRLFGDFQVTLKKHEVREKYIISSLQLKNLETNLWREVTHLWYSSWPAQGVPDDGSAMIAFLIEARSYTRGARGPTVVHCSPGTGRTGTVLAIDLCIREFETARAVDIPRTVYALRRDRAGAVQTRDQYAFIYQVLNLYATKLTGGALDSI